MVKSLVLGAILGGLTAFLWSFISWSVLPWHEKQLHSFQNEDEVSAVIASHAPQSGNYLLPTGPSQEGMNSDQKKAAEEIRMQKMQKGPLVFAAIRKEGFGSFPMVLLTQLFCQMFAALLLTWLLLQTTGLSYARRVAFLAIAGLVHSRQSRRLHADLAPRRPGHRQSREHRQAANRLAFWHISIASTTMDPLKSSSP